MGKRKTLKLRELIDNVNRRLARSTCSAETRGGMISILEGELHRANVYAGFGYLVASEIPDGEIPGISYRDTGTGRTITAAEYSDRLVAGDTAIGTSFPDETRRHYYYDRVVRPV